VNLFLALGGDWVTHSEEQKDSEDSHG
jgi:hypothetical protein